MEKEYTWEKRSEEWIKANPKMGTMYKKYKDETIQQISPLPKIELNKNEIIEELKIIREHKEKFDSGVYAIICEIEKCAYIGQSTNMGNRIRNHKMVLLSPNENSSNTYIKMKAHVLKHGIEAFEFIKHNRIPGAHSSDLIKAENEAMAFFARNGYKLYNSVISYEMREECVICPKDFQPMILKAIELLASKSSFTNDLTNLLNSQISD